MGSDPLLSRKIDNYEIIGRLGRGGMATVYRARQLNMQRDVAIKIMSAELAEDPQFVARFEREAQVIANLQHPRILPVHDFGHEEDTFYLVMRLVEGDTLYHRLLRGPLPLTMAARLLGQIAEALDYAHTHGVVHRDLKPNNVLLDQWDNVYLMDFGLAKMIAASTNLTQSGAVLGTPAYMSPEQWRGDPVDGRSDIYALGVMLYEMVLGKPPFEADTPFSLMYKHLNDAPPPPRDLIPDLPPAVELVILKALEKDINERYQSAGAMAQAFREAVRASIDIAPATVPARQAEPPAESSEPEPSESVIPLPKITPPEQHMPSLPPVPPPSDIRPPAPPIPVPGRVAVQVYYEQAEEGQPSEPRTPPVHFDLPDHTPPAVRSAIEWAAEKMEHVAIPGFVAPADEDAVLPPAPVNTNQWPVPDDALALHHVETLLYEGEPLAGVLYARGTAEWRNWRRLLIVGLVLSIIGGTIGALFDLWLVNAGATICWLYVLVQAFRTWRGSVGHYYVGFTPQRIVILPLTPEGKPRANEFESTAWKNIRRLYLTSEYLWLESPGIDDVYFLGWIPAQGIGGLARQRKWLPGSSIPGLLRAKGFTIKH